MPNGLVHSDTSGTHRSIKLRAAYAATLGHVVARRSAGAAVHTGASGFSHGLGPH